MYYAKNIVSTQDLPNTVGVLYTVPVNILRTIIKEIVLCNHTASSVTYTFHLVPNGGSVANSNMIYDAVALAAHTTIILKLATVIERGATLRGFASSANAISIHVSGVEHFV